MFVINLGRSFLLEQVLGGSAVLRQTIFITSLFGHRMCIQEIFFWNYPPSAERPGLTSIIHPSYTGSCAIVQPVQLVDLLLFTCKPREGGSVRPVDSEI